MEFCNHEYIHSPKTNTYRRRSKSLNDKIECGKNNSYIHRAKHHSPPPRHAHHQPVMKFNTDMWMQDFRESVIKKLFKEERFKAFQKRRGLENVMDVSDEEGWEEQHKLIQSIVQNEWQNYQASPTSPYQQLLQRQDTNNSDIQHLQHQQQSFVNNLPSEIAETVTKQNLSPQWFQYRESA
ncbi:2797_t:CDS:2 [Gigaspora margarita]|uniref:2797_t:CDS:1 n=1 Tax=Gigaspora margarita TaxID=4874 RepID=A0ABN7UTL7_GIGMA|nr:2797_t:CDS:2 [Gigaspora margarita]